MRSLMYASWCFGAIFRVRWAQVLLGTGGGAFCGDLPIVASIGRMRATISDPTGSVDSIALAGGQGGGGSRVWISSEEISTCCEHVRKDSLQAGELRESSQDLAKSHLEFIDAKLASAATIASTSGLVLCEALNFNYIYNLSSFKSL